MNTNSESMVCPCCHHSDIGGERGEKGYQLAHGVTLRCFCKLLFPQIIPAPVDLSNVEFLGAWHDFTEAIRQFQCNVDYRHRHAQLFVQDMMPDCLQAWLIGSAIESAAQREVIKLLWPLQASGRVLRLIEVATINADEYDHCCDLDTLQGLVARSDIEPVWLSWLASHAAKGKAPHQSKTGLSLWAFYGEGHIERCADWAAARARAASGHKQ